MLSVTVGAVAQCGTRRPHDRLDFAALGCGEAVKHGFLARRLVASQKARHLLAGCPLRIRIEVKWLFGSYAFGPISG